MSCFSYVGVPLCQPWPWILPLLFHFLSSESALSGSTLLLLLPLSFLPFYTLFLFSFLLLLPLTPPFLTHLFPTTLTLTFTLTYTYNQTCPQSANALLPPRPLPSPPPQTATTRRSTSSLVSAKSPPQQRNPEDARTLAQTKTKTTMRTTMTVRMTARTDTIPLLAVTTTAATVSANRSVPRASARAARSHGKKSHQQQQQHQARSLLPRAVQTAPSHRHQSTATLSTLHLSDGLCGSIATVSTISSTLDTPRPLSRPRRPSQTSTCSLEVTSRSKLDFQLTSFVFISLLVLPTPVFFFLTQRYLNEQKRKRKKESDEMISGRAMGPPAPGSVSFFTPKKTHPTFNRRPSKGNKTR